MLQNFFHFYGPDYYNIFLELFRYIFNIIPNCLSKSVNTFKKRWDSYILRLSKKKYSKCFLLKGWAKKVSHTGPNKGFRKGRKVLTRDSKTGSHLRVKSCSHLKVKVFFYWETFVVLWIFLSQKITKTIHKNF